MSPTSPELKGLGKASSEKELLDFAIALEEKLVAAYLAATSETRHRGRRSERDSAGRAPTTCSHLAVLREPSPAPTRAASTAARPQRSQTARRAETAAARRRHRAATAASRSTLIRWMGIEDANSAGNVHGGAVMKLCDEAAAIAAIRHCGQKVVTAAMDRMTFIEPVHLGELLALSATRQRRLANLDGDRRAGRGRKRPHRLAPPYLDRLPDDGRARRRRPAGAVPGLLTSRARTSSGATARPRRAARNRLAEREEILGGRGEERRSGSESRSPHRFRAATLNLAVSSASPSQWPTRRRISASSRSSPPTTRRAWSVESCATSAATPPTSTSSSSTTARATRPPPTPRRRAPT